IYVPVDTPPVFFFFSSRRRHPRFSRDWSSDVCSSDLLLFRRIVMSNTVRLHRVFRAPPARVYRAFLDPDAMAKWLPPNGFTGKRSEVRRVGKECVRGLVRDWLGVVATDIAGRIAGGRD